MRIRKKYVHSLRFQDLCDEIALDPFLNRYSGHTHAVDSIPSSGMSLGASARLRLQSWASYALSVTGWRAGRRKLRLVHPLSRRAALSNQMAHFNDSFSLLALFEKVLSSSWSRCRTMRAAIPLWVDRTSIHSDSRLLAALLPSSFFGFMCDKPLNTPFGL